MKVLVRSVLFRVNASRAFGVVLSAMTPTFKSVYPLYMSA